MARAPGPHVRHLGRDALWRVAVHQVRIAGAGDQLLRGLGLAPRVHGGPGGGQRLRLEDGIFHPVVLAREAEARLRPHAAHHREPFLGAGVARVVLIESHAVLLRFTRPPRRHHVDGQAAAADAIDVGGLLGEQRGQMEGGPHGHHELEPLGHRRQRRRRAPGVERGRVRTFDIVEIELGDEGHVEADRLAPLGQPAHVRPARFHPLVGDVPQPAAEYREPVAVAHRQAAARSR